MCFPKCRPECTPLFDKEDGSVNQENSNDGVFIPKTIHHHIDSLLLNFDIDSDTCILAFIYEAGNEVFIIWTSAEAVDKCYKPFSEITECPEFELF